MTRWQISTHAAPPPRAPYSQAIGASGRFVFLSGQGPFTTSDELVVGSFADQARQTFANVIALAEAAGGGAGSIVRVGVYLRDMVAHFAEMNEIYREYFTDPLPARTTIQSNLPRFDIEVDAVLVLPD